MSRPVATDRMARFLEMTSAEREEETLGEMFQRMTCRVPGIEGAEGRPEGLPAICSTWNVPYGRMIDWLMADAERYARYQRALEVRSHELVDEVVGIADRESPATQRDRLRVDTRFRVAQFHAPRMYAPRQEVTHELGQSFTEALLEISKRRALERPAERVIEPEPPEDDVGI